MHFFIKMRKSLFQVLEIPQGVEVNIDGATFSVKGPEGELKRIFNINKLVFEIRDGKIWLGSEKATKTEKRLMNTITAHIKNMMQGVQTKFEYQVKICSSHFPMTVDVQGNEALVKNFLGEKIPRKIKIPENVDVKIEKELITITSSDKEIAGQTAANFEKSTRISNRDRRVFQDGLFIINKCGREM